jgi:hypothetical protein
MCLPDIHMLPSWKADRLTARAVHRLPVRFGSGHDVGPPPS